jgi:hypothetical protein
LIVEAISNCAILIPFANIWVIYAVMVLEVLACAKNTALNCRSGWGIFRTICEFRWNGAE